MGSNAHPEDSTSNNNNNNNQSRINAVAPPTTSGAISDWLQRSRSPTSQEVTEIVSPLSPASPGTKNNRSSQVTRRLEVLDQRLRSKDKPPPPWIKSEQADTILGIIIALNAAFVGVDVEFSDYDDALKWPFWAVESCFLCVFLVEIILRMRAELPRIRNFFDAWGTFDVVVTVTGCLDAWVLTPLSGIGGEDNPMSSFTVLRLLRLVRLVRLVRVLRMFRDLVLLVRTLQESVSAVLWMCILLGIITYTGSILTMVLLGQQYPDDDLVQQYFGTLGNALFSHFCIVTLEGWIEIAEAAMDKSALWAVYFVAMISLTNFALVNLMIGVVVEGILRFASEQETELNAFVAESEQFRTTLQHLWNHADLDINGETSREDVRQLLSQDETKLIMDIFGINLSVPPPMLHSIMGLCKDGRITFQEFYESCLRLCGSKKSIHSMFVQHDICECQRRLSEQLQRLEDKIHSRGVLSGALNGADDTLTHAALSVNGTHTNSGTLTATKPSASSVVAVQGSPPARGSAVVADLAERMSRLLQVQRYLVDGVQALKEQCALDDAELPELIAASDDVVTPVNRQGLRSAAGPNATESIKGWEGCSNNLFAATCSPEQASRRQGSLSPWTRV
mmetsp:Transcript_67343/g.161464  ORF Transcript_67343/g.161464 Transcript_67343/m.161464 type:complete len:621 (+) Transcript_67343:172-2034(+)